MTAPAVIVMGRRLKALEHIPTIGEALGLKRSAAYRASREWPLVGPECGRYVVTERLLLELGIPYDVDPGDQEPDRD